MPSYAYDCERCGPFEEFRSMALFADPCECPDCGAPAPRQLAFAAVGAGATLQASAAARQSRSHRAGCGCCTPAARRGLQAEAVAAGAPKRTPKAAVSGSFLDRS